LYCLTAYCGLRRAEIAGLPWSEVDLDAGLITVRETRLDGDEDPADLKSEAGKRPVALSAMLATLLKAWRKQQLRERIAWGGAWTDSGLVFTREDGQPLRPGHISEHFELLVHRAGLPPVRYHDLRHGAATLSLAAGVDIKIVQEMLGHSTSSFTRNVYASVVPEIATAAAEAVAAIVPVQALAACHQFLAAEEQVEAVGPALIAGLRMGVEGSLAHRVALDGDELAAVGLGRPPADGPLVGGREVRLVRRRAGDRERVAEVDHRDLRRDLGDLDTQHVDGRLRLGPQSRREADLVGRYGASDPR